jgi:cysteine-rich repeat protein
MLLASSSAHAGGLELLAAYGSPPASTAAVNAPQAVTISPDGQYVYVGATGGNAIGIFSRDPATGLLSFEDDVVDNQDGVDGIAGVRAVSVSPDGNHLYAAGFNDKAVAVFVRNQATGELSWLEVHKDNVTPNVTVLDGAHGIDLSPDGAHVYVASAVENSVTVFSRNAGTGRLTWVQQLQDNATTRLLGAETVAVSPDGAHVYVAAQDDNAINVFSRNPTTGMLTWVANVVNGGGISGLTGVQAVTVSPNGAHVYTAATQGTIVAFSRNASTGLLTSVQVTTDIPNLDGAEWVAVSPNGSMVYAVSDVMDKLVVYQRNTTTGSLTRVEVHSDSLGELEGAESLVVSPDNTNVYVVGDARVAAFGNLCGNGRFDAGEDCDDGNLVNGDCCSATCQSEPAGTICADDGNPCSDDKCNGAGICLHVNNTAPCDDGKFCTTNDRCANQVCNGTMMDCSGLDGVCQVGVCDEGLQTCVMAPEEDGAACDDGDLCTQTDTCQAGVCTGGNPVPCTALDQCHDVGVCDPATGLCSDPVKADGTGCDDANLCTQADSCLGGFCVGADPIICTAMDDCHEPGVCDPATGICSTPSSSDGTPCDDGDLCTQSDVCMSGVCSGMAPVVCTALDQCHAAGVCNPATGVCSDPAVADGTACDDGDLCTQVDVCMSGVCTGTTPVTCSALDQCHAAGVCNPATGVCSDPAVADGTACDDGSLCTQTDTCVAGVCAGANPVICAPRDQCHAAGVCNPATGACSDPAVADGTACDDGNACTQADSCVGGACTGANPVVCTALDQCHAAGVCNPATGVCSDPAVADGTACDDGSACTQTDTCEAGVCTGANPVVCTASDQCHVAGVCDPATGVCSDPLATDGTPCEEGDLCTTNDTCVAGACTAGGPVVCTASDQCHVAGVCDPATGVCSDPPAADGTACDNGLCTENETCQAGVCTGTNPVVCTALDQCHVAGVCDPATGVCSNPMVADGTACDDGNACTQTDTCEAGACMGANPVVCTPSDGCHAAGVCDPATGVCSDPAVADGTACDDGNACTQTDTCEAGACMGANPVVCTALDQCHVAGVCDPATGVCSDPAVADGTACDDASLCTQNETCVAGVCTGATSVVCTALDQCHVAGVCDPATGVCSDPVVADGTACEDGDLCTRSETCQAGVCMGATPVVCAASDQCHVAGVCDPATGVCSDPTAADGTACDDGNLCTRTDACQAGVCTGGNPRVCMALDQCHAAGECDPATGLCSDPAVADGTACDDGDLCTQTDTCQAGLCTGASPVVCAASDQCHVAGVCDPATGACSDPAVTDGTACDDGNLCTQTDTCVAGDCSGGIPVVCTASDECHAAGVCDPATGACSDPLAADGTSCEDGNLCTEDDTCVAGACTAGRPVVCTASDQCHEAGVCDPATGVCSDPAKPSGFALTFPVQADSYTEFPDVGQPAQNFGTSSSLRVDALPPRTTYLRFTVSGIDGFEVESAILRLETKSDSNDGSDEGGIVRRVSNNDWDELTITHANRPLLDGAALDRVGPVDPSSVVDFNVTAGVTGDGVYTFGIESDSTNGAEYRSRNGGSGWPELIVTLVATCDDGNACTSNDMCVAGVCAGADSVICTASDQCHAAGVCDPATGLCSDPLAADGTGCDDGNLCSRTDACVAGVCVGGDSVICTASDQCHAAGVCDPATGLCSDPLAADGTACDDGDLCTRSDTCAAGQCMGGSPVTCTASDQCHDPGVCNPATGACSNPAKLDGTGCDDGSLCTRSDACMTGVCVGADPVICASTDPCHGAGVCDPATGVCSQPPVRPDGASCADGDACNGAETCQGGVCTAGAALDCNDGNPCTTDTCHPASGCASAPIAGCRRCATASECDDGNSCTSNVCAGGACVDTTRVNGAPCDDGAFCTVGDACQGGVCAGSPRRCAGAEECSPMACDETADACVAQPKANGTACDDGSRCTRQDVCIAGVCTGSDPVICTASDQCHQAGVCDPATGTCSNPARSDGTVCDDGDRCSGDDRCTGGTCLGTPLPDADADGFCDLVDVCPTIDDPGQADADGDGLGDACQCTAPAPGRCIAGGGSKRTDCLAELMPAGPVALDARGRKVKSTLTCSDGDPACDLDGARDGTCTFGVAVCFGNADPRFPKCTPEPIQSMEVLKPRTRNLSSLGGLNATLLEQAFGDLGLEVRRRRRVVSGAVTTIGGDVCSPMVRLATPAPQGNKKKSKQKFQIQARTAGGMVDKDKLTLICR